jgi:predicted molibdopterin-dependent oxidoreductase YjgC
MAHDEFTIEVNGRRVKARPGELLLTVLRREGTVIPTLCHDERLTPYGGCRLCLVARRDAGGGLIPTCYTPVQRKMVIETDSPDVHEARRRQLQLLILNHRMECPVCDRAGDCRLQDLAYEYGVEDEIVNFERRLHPRDEASPIIVRDPEKCVLCGRCVRLCDEVQGVAEIGIFERGLQSVISTEGGRPLDCEFCGQCVNACPVGALVPESPAPRVPVWLRESVTTTCSYCSCGCQLDIESYEGRVQRVASRIAGSPNSGKLCAKGWLGWDATAASERLDNPLVRRNGELVEVNWVDALQSVIEGFQTASGAGKAVVGLGTPRMTSEDAYLFQRLFRTGFGSPHVGTGPAAGIGALVDGVGQALGVRRSTASFEDLAAADLVFVLRADPSRTHPLVKTELVQAIRQRGQKLILAHALSGGMERHASRYLPLRPGSEETLLLGLASLLLHQRRVRSRHGGAPGFGEYKEALESWAPGEVAEATGLHAEDLAATEKLLAEARSAVVVVITGNGIPGDEAAVAQRACELLAVLDKLDGPGCGILVLGEKSNVQGVVETGLHAALLPGGREASSAESREACSAAWGSPVPEAQGWNAAQALRAAALGEVGLLYLVGQDPLGDSFSGSIPRTAVERADLVVVQDGFLTRTAAAADIVLPITILGERTGQFTAADGTPRELRRATRPVHGIPQDGQIFTELSRLCGTSTVSGPALRAEMRRLVREPHGATVQPRFRKPGPIPAARGRERPFFLDLSPQLFHSGRTTLRSATLKELGPPVSLRIAPGDAELLGISDGAMVRVTAGDTKLLLRACLDRTVRPGAVAALPQSLESRERGVEGSDDALQWVSVERV